MIKTKKTDDVTINSYFASKTDKQIALSMSSIIAKLINRDINSNGDSKDEEKALTST